MNQRNFETLGINLVALQDASRLLKTLEVGSKYSLTDEQRQQALVIIEQVQDNSQATLLDVVNVLLTIPAQKAFALDIQKCSLPS